MENLEARKTRSKAQADRIKGPPVCTLWSILCLKAPEEDCRPTLSFSGKLCFHWVWGRGRGGNCRWGGSRGTREGRRLGGPLETGGVPSSLRWWPLHSEVWVECSSPGHRLPSSHPPPAARPPGARGAAGIQRNLPRYRCVHSWPDSRLPRPVLGPFVRRHYAK